MLEVACGLEEAVAQRGGDLGGCARRRPLADVRRRRAQQHQAGQPPGCAVPPAGRRRDRSDDEGAERERLGHGREAADHPARDDDRQRATGGAQVLHRQGGSSHGASAGVGVGMWWTEMRRRNTQ